MKTRKLLTSLLIALSIIIPAITFTGCKKPEPFVSVMGRIQYKNVDKTFSIKYSLNKKGELKVIKPISDDIKLHLIVQTYGDVFGFVKDGDSIRSIRSNGLVNFDIYNKDFKLKDPNMESAVRIIGVVEYENFKIPIDLEYDFNTEGELKAVKPIDKDLKDFLFIIKTSGEVCNVTKEGYTIYSYGPVDLFISPKIHNPKENK